VTSPPRIADDVAFFLLEKEGIFFSERTQEIHRFNSAAAYLWCCIEEKLAPDEMVVAYARAFGVDADEAERQVAESLHRWQGLGYLSGVDMPNPTPIPLTTALGRLLTNPSLREQFAREPRAVARRLAVREPDLAFFLSLDAEELEEQAQALERKRKSGRLKARRAAKRTLVSSRATTPLLPIDAAAFDLERRYELLSSIICIRFPSRAAFERLHPVLAHLECDAADGREEVVLDISVKGNVQTLSEDGREVDTCEGLDRLTPIVLSHIRRICVGRHPYVLQVHAGALFDGRRCILLPADPGHGKTTLTAALMRAGYQLLTDEVSLLESGTLRIWPAPLPLAIKPGSLQPLSASYPQLRDLDSHLRDDLQRVRYLSPEHAQLVPDLQQTYPVGRIVFPRYRPQSPTELRSIGRAEALTRLLHESFPAPEPFECDQIKDLVRWMRTLDCFELSLSSLDEAVERLQALA
jgi:hypothetical protein